MALPRELLNIPEDTAVIGNVDAFIAYIESGQAAQDWDARMAIKQQELEWMCG